MTTNKPLKAYSVQADEAGEIIFATSGIAARRMGANKLDTEFEYILSCNRAPWADQYAEQGWVPVKALLEQGWWWSCTGCETLVSEDSEDFDGNPHDPVIEERDLYCSPACKAAEEAEVAARKLRKEQRTQAALEKWPGIEVLWVNDHKTDALVTFKFPSSTGTAHWRVGESTVMLTRPDLSAWEAFTGAGSLAATERHLSDMQRITFTLLEPVPCETKRA